MIAALLLAYAAPSRPAAASVGYAFPRFSGYVVDQAGVIDAGERRRLTDRLGHLQRTTKHQLVVVTVNSLGGRSVESYATALGRSWGVGRRGVNDGVLLLVAPHEHRVRIEVGNGLRRELTDAEAAAVIQRRILPAFRAGHMEQGIEAGVDGVLAEIAPGGRGK